jgi:hypothetical protein
MVWQPNPPRDAGGSVLPHDDPVTIPGEWTLFRHVHREQWAARDERTGYPRPQSNAFAFSTEGSRSMSVDIEPAMLEEGLPSTHYAFRAGKGVVRITAARARELQFLVVLSRYQESSPWWDLGAESRDPQEPARQIPTGSQSQL